MLSSSSGRRRLDGPGFPGRVGICVWFLQGPLGRVAGVACCRWRGLLATPHFFLPSRAISAAPALSSLRLLGFSVLNSFFVYFFFFACFSLFSFFLPFFRFFLLFFFRCFFFSLFFLFFFAPFFLSFFCVLFFGPFFGVFFCVFFFAFFGVFFFWLGFFLRCFIAFFFLRFFFVLFFFLFFVLFLVFFFCVFFFCFFWRFFLAWFFFCVVLLLFFCGFFCFLLAFFFCQSDVFFFAFFLLCFLRSFVLYLLVFFLVLFFSARVEKHVGIVPAQKNCLVGGALCDARALQKTPGEKVPGSIPPRRAPATIYWIMLVQASATAAPASNAKKPFGPETERFQQIVSQCQQCQLYTYIHAKGFLITVFFLAAYPVGQRNHHHRKQQEQKKQLPWLMPRDQ